MLEKKYDRYGVVILVVRDQRYLVIKRSQSVIAPGKLCFPGGGIEPGESPEEAVRREFREEIGIECTPIREIRQSVTPWNVHLRWWTAEIPETEILAPDPKEVETVFWLTVEEIIAHPETLQSNLQFLEMLTKSDTNIKS